ncbi:MAG: Flp pilus assembly complex ATPase component TadA [Lachnospiraceae bacterium]|nr:Flp pilus assembly complex ATPase component TadA [Lachnospiraceae bacterium]
MQFFPRETNTEARMMVREEPFPYFQGYHVLEPLIKDDEISDIKVLSYDRIRVKRLGRREDSELTFASAQELKQFTEFVAAKNQVSISRTNAMQSFTDKSSSKDFILRFNISQSIINSVDTPYLHIRKIPKKKHSLEDLTELGMLTQKHAEYLRRQLQKGYILIAGKGASGKTTLLNALLDEIPRDKSVLVVQENEELFSRVHPDMMFQHVLEQRGESKVRYGLKELSINALLLDLDYIVIGEIKGGEALYFLNAAFTGHLGLATVHGQSGEAALYKLADYVKYESDYSQDEIKKMLGCISTVCYMRDFKLWTITEVKLDEKRNLMTRNVYEREHSHDLDS